MNCPSCGNYTSYVEEGNNIKLECVPCNARFDANTQVLYHESNEDDTYVKLTHILDQMPFHASRYGVRIQCINEQCKSPVVAMFRTKGDEKIYYVCHCGTKWTR
jgi:DNA-directed RNA polymerase subunit M/transcription elongation factor TFIIS